MGKKVAIEFEVNTATGELEVKRLINTFGLAGKSGEAGAKQAQNAFDQLGFSMGTVKNIAAGVGLTFGAWQIGAILKGAVTAGIEFESSFAGVKKTVDATDAEFEQLSQGLRNMAKQIPVNVNELNKIAEAAGQLGIKKGDVLEFTKVMANLGATTNLSADQAATSIARMANIMGTSSKDFERLGSTIVDLGNKSAATESEIVEMALRIPAQENRWD